MAGKPTVTMTLAGDEKKLTSAFDKVGDASKRMGADVDKASDDFKKTGRSVEDFAEKSDTVDTRAMGFRDTITGLQDSFRGLSDSSLSTGDRLLTLGMGVGDLASGFTNLIIPALGRFGTYLASTTVGTWAITAAQTAWAAITRATSAAMALLNATMRANPILFIVGLIATLVGAFILLWNKSAGFRNFFIGVWRAIRTAVGNTVAWLRGAWNGLANAASSVAHRIGGFFAGMGTAIKNAFRSAVNFAIDLLNGAIGGINVLIDGANLVPGVNIPHIPNIPRLHTGGVVPGMPGEEQLMLLQGGERVSTSGQGGGGRLVVVGDVDSAFATYLKKLVRDGTLRLA